MWGSELRQGSLPGAGDGEARLRGEIGGHGSGDQPLKPILPKADTRQPCGPALGLADGGGLRDQAGLRIPEGHSVAEAKGRATGESEACMTGHAGARVAGTFTATAGSTTQRMGSGPGLPAQPNVAGGPDEDLGRLGDGLGSVDALPDG